MERDLARDGDRRGGPATERRLAKVGHIGLLRVPDAKAYPVASTGRHRLEANRRHRDVVRQRIAEHRGRVVDGAHAVAGPVRQKHVEG